MKRIEKAVTEELDALVAEIQPLVAHLSEAETRSQGLVAQLSGQIAKIEEAASTAEAQTVAMRNLQHEATSIRDDLNRSHAEAESTLAIARHASDKVASAAVQLQAWKEDVLNSNRELTTRVLQAEAAATEVRGDARRTRVLLYVMTGMVAVAMGLALAVRFS